MQMFTVPQFIDVEDKIIGPITTRQFIICLVGLGLLVLAAYLLAIQSMSSIMPTPATFANWVSLRAIWWIKENAA